MTVRGRLVLLVTLLIVAATLSTAAITTAISWRATVEQTRRDGILLAQLLAQSINLTEHVPLTVDDIVGDDMLGHAMLLAEMADLANELNADASNLAVRMRRAAAQAGMGELWVLNNDGNPVHTSLDDIDSSIGAESGAFQAPGWAALLQNRRFDLITEPQRRNLDGGRLKYAAVRLPNGQGVAVVARDADELRRSSESIGVRRLVETALSGDTIEAVWVLDSKGDIGVHVSLGEHDEETEKSELALAASAADTATPQAEFSGDLWKVLVGTAGPVSVAAPLLDSDGLPNGSALLRLSTEPMAQAVRAQMLYTAGITVALLLAGLAATFTLARFLTQPISAVTRAAGQMEQRVFEPASLNHTAGRSDELGRLARVFQSMARDVLAREEELEALVRARTAELQAKNQQLELAHAQMEEELLAAQSLQAAILPTQFPTMTTHAIDALMVPALQLGGDFYDVFMIDEHQLAVTIADVSGKGVPAAFFMAISRTILQTTGKEGWSPAECLRRANDQLCQTNPMSLFVTVFYGILDTRTGQFRYANGGHNPPCLIHRDDGTVLRIKPTDGIALGVMEDMPFEEGETSLLPGDTLFMFTDGISEAMDIDGREFTEGRLTQALTDTHVLELDRILKRVREHVQIFVGEAPQSDDLTCLVLRYAPTSLPIVDARPETGTIATYAGD